MTQEQYRQVALGAARSQLRKMGVQPEAATAEEMLQVIDDLARVEPDLVASRWYLSASDRQIGYLCRDWENWLEDQAYTDFRPDVDHWSSRTI